MTPARARPPGREWQRRQGRVQQHSGWTHEVEQSGQRADGAIVAVHTERGDLPYPGVRQRLRGCLPPLRAGMPQVLTNGDLPRQGRHLGEPPEQPMGIAGSEPGLQRLAEQHGLARCHRDALRVHGVEGAERVADRYQPVGPISQPLVVPPTVGGLPMDPNVPDRIRGPNEVGDSRIG